MKRIFDYLFHKPRLLIAGIWRKVGRLVPDEPYLKIMFKILMGKKLNLNSPKTFCEKLQWLKLYDRRPEYVKMVDKYAVKEYVAGIVGEEYIIPTLGVWDRPEDIDWDSLPDQFVLKCTHDSGGLVICKDKSKLDKEAAIKKLNHGLKQDYYKVWREWPYKNVPKRIIGEKYISPAAEVKDLPDYKWYCFDGKPVYCQVIQNRSTQETIDFFDTEWNHQDFIGLNKDAVHSSVIPERPNDLEEQIRLARHLAKDMPYSRIDLFHTDENTYFGEITLYPASGFGRFIPEQYERMLGEMLHLPGE